MGLIFKNTSRYGATELWKHYESPYESVCDSIRYMFYGKKEKQEIMNYYISIYNDPTGKWDCLIAIRENVKMFPFLGTKNAVLTIKPDSIKLWGSSIKTFYSCPRIFNNAMKYCTFKYYRRKMNMSQPPIK